MFNVMSIPAFYDNYIWCIIAEENLAYVVDPGTAKPVIEFLHNKNLELAGILITHHHHDHTGGIEDLKAYVNHELPVYGPDSEMTAQITIKLKHEQTFSVEGINAPFKVIEIPGHTLDHIAYLINGHLFCGDTLFSAGCGRLFEGTPKQMHHSLSLISGLPEETKVYPAHEYTMGNLNFARNVEPNNSDLQNYINRCSRLTEQNIPTLPSSINTELKVNPFLRTNSREIINTLVNQFPDLKQADAVARFAALRKWKDNF